MRINQFLAASSGLSRRAADQAVREGRVAVNGQPASLGQTITDSDTVTLDGEPVTPAPGRTIMFYKPVGVVCSRDGQGSPTIYDELPDSLAGLNPVGRLDKDTSGLLVLTNDGRLHQKLSHPSQGKAKEYDVTLDQPISAASLEALQGGVDLEDGPSRPKLLSSNGKNLKIELDEGRNRQVRRTFEALGYTVIKLHRGRLGKLELGSLKPGGWRDISPEEVL